MASRTLLMLGLAIFGQAAVASAGDNQAATASAGDNQKLQENSTAAVDGKTTASNCGCLSWASIYYQYKAFCGRGNELYFFTKHGFPGAYAATEPITGVLHKVCYDFFMNLNSPVCVNYDLYPFPAKEKSNAQWCYVSNDCNDLNGGAFATNVQGFAQSSWHNLQSNTALAWKFCDSENPADTESTRLKSVSEVVQIGEDNDVPLSRMLRAAYPVVNISWGHAHYWYEALNRNYQVGRTIEQMVDLVPTQSAAQWGSKIVEVHTALAELAKSEKPTILDSIDHGDNFHVVQGRAAWSVVRRENGNAVYLSGHFAQEFDVTCLMGCASRREVSADSVDLETI